MMYRIFDIKRYSINDGPGIRITFFFKGCPLSCLWCHNPEGISRTQTRMYTPSKCILCGACVHFCPSGALSMPRRGASGGIRCDASSCTLCGKCTEVCPTKAVEMAARSYTAEQIYAEIAKERPFFESSGGGVTFSGGEPLYQGESIIPLLDFISEAAARDGYTLHRTLDTTLFAPEALVRGTLGRCELYLVDLKHMDSATHRRCCGVPNEPILSNLRVLAEAGTDYIIRIPYIIGVNADEANVTATATFLASLPRLPRYVELLPYHDIGKSKHSRMGTVYNPDAVPMSAPSEADLQAAVDIFAKYGVPSKF